MTTDDPTPALEASLADAPNKTSDLPDDYPAFLSDIKAQIKKAQLDTALTISRNLTLLYWRIGREILQRQAANAWGRRLLLFLLLTSTLPSPTWKVSRLVT